MAKKAKPAGMRRGVRILFYGSLVLNFLFVGLVVGIVTQGVPRPDGPPHRDPVAPYTRAFDSDQRHALRRALRQTFVDARAETRDAVLQDYARALVLLRADSFDAEAWQALLARQAQRAEARRLKGNIVLTTYLERMTAADRAAYADRLEDEIDRFGRKRWRDTPK